MTIVAPKHLGTLRRIMDEFGVGADKVKVWWAQGAPIAVEYDKKGKISGYSAEYNKLQEWREIKSKARTAA